MSLIRLFEVYTRARQAKHKFQLDVKQSVLNSARQDGKTRDAVCYRGKSNATATRYPCRDFPCPRSLARLLASKILCSAFWPFYHAPLDNTQGPKYLLSAAMPIPRPLLWARDLLLCLRKTLRRVSCLFHILRHFYFKSLDFGFFFWTYAWIVLFECRKKFCWIKLDHEYISSRIHVVKY